MAGAQAITVQVVGAQAHVASAARTQCGGGELGARAEAHAVLVGRGAGRAQAIANRRQLGQGREVLTAGAHQKDDVVGTIGLLTAMRSLLLRSLRSRVASQRAPRVPHTSSSSSPTTAASLREGENTRTVLASLACTGRQKSSGSNDSASSVGVGGRNGPS